MGRDARSRHRRSCARNRGARGRRQDVSKHEHRPDPQSVFGGTMSKVRVHNFSVSLDGFATGVGLTFDAPFGHAGRRLHEWMMATQFGRPILGQTGGSAGVDNAFAERLDVGFGAEIMGRGTFGQQTGPWTDDGTDGEWRRWWGAYR